MNLFCHFCTLQFFNYGILWSLLTPLLWEIDICAHGLFCTKFNAQQLLCEAFLEVLHIFGSVETWSESTSLFLYSCLCTFFACFKDGGPLVSLRQGSYLARFSINICGVEWYQATKIGKYRRAFRLQKCQNCVAPWHLKLGKFCTCNCTEMGKQIHFRAHCCQKYLLHGKLLQIKVVEN